MPEVTIDKNTAAIKDKVFFPGTATLSDKEAESFEKAKAAEPEAEDDADAPKAKKGK